MTRVLARCRLPVAACGASALVATLGVSVTPVAAGEPFKFLAAVRHHLQLTPTGTPTLVEQGRVGRKQWSLVAFTARNRRGHAAFCLFMVVGQPRTSRR